MPSVLFAGHDPGSLNHVRPIMGAARSQGMECFLLPLRPAAESGKVWPEAGTEAAVQHCEGLLQIVSDRIPELSACVMGISTNQAELDMVRACKARGIPTAVLVDFMPGHRLEARDPAAFFPALFMVTNEKAERDIRERYVSMPLSISVVGSTYLESLVLDKEPSQWGVVQVYEQLKLDREKETILPFFISPDDMVPDAATAVHTTVRMLAEDLGVVCEWPV
mmetsp:Transcript_37859/g.106963  ORF Transcript_37859/g.106963 Transcript_37859/m.106963 type:complete len:222 (+) Transcript_37859:175-840(+)|eukprot:CAMPEP_0117678678 /NCGR_PEP_ID=MMETSP0804-20121206/17423_1 /TAXON_ID=1074897 /ORGANISM="Tetraselmis astigmatica, Strain CCMP880" /LENGTH=221 /DNA_ID=CAMNT_0005488077 /DNA_START=182 /DNA_END=847 /DNA_ORIENTATION=+